MMMKLNKSTRFQCCWARHNFLKTLLEKFINRKHQRSVKVDAGVILVLLFRIRAKKSFQLLFFRLQMFISCFSPPSVFYGSAQRKYCFQVFTTNSMPLMLAYCVDFTTLPEKLRPSPNGFCASRAVKLFIFPVITF